MGVEIDMLAVGDGARSGDAIAIRYGTALFGYRVMIIDGGTKASGERLVQHVRNVYGTNRVDDIVNSHPDGDHASGLSVVVDQLEVGQLWMHRPWDYAENIRHLFHDGRITDNSLEQRFREALQSAHELEVAALARKIPIIEPYQGSRIGPFIVLSPNHDWYLNDLVPNFRGAPALKQETALDAMVKTILDAAKAGVKWVQEALDIETLSEDGETSAQNDSSVVMYGDFDGQKVLLTGDAGIVALARAHAYATSIGLRLDDLWMLQVPHHGSRNNVTPTILNLIKGKCAIASAAAQDDLHPRRVVTNALRRRGAKVYATKGVSLRLHAGMGERPGWDTPAVEIPFYTEVEA
jgi:beta-lactamase superfamily II metal-dependent hydrolase